MRRLDFLLDLARSQTENDEFSDSTGIPNKELIQHANDAQYRMLSLITAKHQTIFVKESADIPVTTDQEQYDLPDDVFLENRISSVEYSHTNLDRDFFKLEPLLLIERRPGSSGFPSGYIRRSGKILLRPIPSSSTGKLRINYVRRIAELDLRRGRILSVTLDNNTNQVTALTLDVSESNFDAETLVQQDFICAVNKLGVQQMSRISVDSIDANTGVVTLDSSYTFDDGETLTVGDYITNGFDSSTHSELPKICERYIIAYITWKLFKRDSSEDGFEQRNEIKSMETDILEAFGDTTDDIINIPETEEYY